MPAARIVRVDALGEQVHFTGGELADIIAFLQDDEAQQTFVDTNLTAEAGILMRHQHGDVQGPKAHAKEVGPRIRQRPGPTRTDGGISGCSVAGARGPP